MRLTVLFFALCLAASAQSLLIDRIAIIVNNSIIKDSDIARDIRLTDFLNGDPLSLDLDARKKAAARLVDQVFIRREIRLGDYSTATLQQAQNDMASLARDKFKSQAGMDAALSRYGLSEADLQMHLEWQLTVLAFIDARFKPAAYIPDDQIDAYIKDHQAELNRQHPGATESQLRLDAQNLLSGQKENQIFFTWLDNQKKEAQIKYMEDSLQ